MKFIELNNELFIRALNFIIKKQQQFLLNKSFANILSPILFFFKIIYLWKNNIRFNDL